MGLEDRTVIKDRRLPSCCSHSGECDKQRMGKEWNSRWGYVLRNINEAEEEGKEGGEVILDGGGQRVPLRGGEI